MFREKVEYSVTVLSVVTFTCKSNGNDKSLQFLKVVVINCNSKISVIPESDLTEPHTTGTSFDIVVSQMDTTASDTYKQMSMRMC